MKQILNDNIYKIKDEIRGLNKYLYDNPELGNKEFKSCKKLISILHAHGFNVQDNYIGIPTAFRAEYGSGKPKIALLCEYDALPDIGHGCGHNMIASIGVCASIALSEAIKSDGLTGSLVVLGCPAEETNGAKVAMSDNGVFQDIDAAMMIHPADFSTESGSTLAMQALQFEYAGKAAHAAGNPYDGINALDGVILLFNSINALRQQLKSDVRIHGIIKEGGVAANIIPDRAVAQFYVRSDDKAYLNEVIKKVKNCAYGAATATGCTVDISNYELTYDNLITNTSLEKAFIKNLNAAGVGKILPSKDASGSSDIGNVSHLTPAIHPYIGIAEKHIPSHSREFAEATQTDYAFEMLLKAAYALSATGYDLLTEKSLLSDIKEEFKSNVAKSD